MIEIIFKNGENDKWRKDNYTDYIYDGKYFIIIKDKQWVGFYNLSDIFKIVVKTEEK